MPTRRQDSNSREFRQDAFASSAEYERGVLGNLVAARCAKLMNRETVEMLWWLQQISWREGGLELFAADFLACHRELIGTRSMHEFGVRPGQTYTADQVRAVRSELKSHAGRAAERFPLKGETVAADLQRLGSHEGPGFAELEQEIEREAMGRPNGYPVEALLKACTMEACAFADVLKQFLLDPRTEPEKGLWNMPSVWAALKDCRSKEAEQAGRQLVETDVVRQVYEELDYCLEARTFVLIEGREGIGKSESAAAWCARHPGRAIYVRLEMGSDETTLYRAIARRIGTACSYQRKAVEMRARIQDALQGGNLMLVLDEAHFLWPQSERVQGSMPKRMDWLRTALVDFGVPVALVSTPQYFKKACDRFRRGGWNSLQIQRRLARTTVLPEPNAIAVDDVLAIARSYFPEVDGGDLKRVAALAVGSVGFLTSIRHLRDRCKFLTGRRPGKSARQVLAEALAEAGLPPSSADANKRSEASLKPALRRPPRSPFPVISARSQSPSRLVVQQEIGAP